MKRNDILRKLQRFGLVFLLTCALAMPYIASASELPDQAEQTAEDQSEEGTNDTDENTDTDHESGSNADTKDSDQAPEDLAEPEAPPIDQDHANPSDAAQNSNPDGTLTAASEDILTADQIALNTIIKQHPEVPAEELLAQAVWSEDGSLTQLNWTAFPSGKELTGTLNLSAFQSLTQAVLSENNLTSLAAQNMPKLAYLVCNDNQLTALNIQKLPNLQVIYCSRNQLKSGLTFNGTEYQKLKTILAADNYLTSISASNLPKLNYLSCHNNNLSKLTLGSLPKLQKLYISRNNIGSALDVSKFSALTELTCDYNRLSSLNIKGLSLKTTTYDNAKTILHHSGKQVTGVKVRSASVCAVKSTVSSSAAISPSNARVKNIRWSSSNTKIATVSSTGKVTGKKRGTVYVRASAMDGNGKTGSYKVKITSKITSIKLGKSKYTLKKGKKLKLKVKIAPSTAYQKVKWSSSNKKIATVDSKGKVTAKKKKGKVTITATAADGSQRKAKCKITVK